MPQPFKAEIKTPSGSLLFHQTGASCIAIYVDADHELNQIGYFSGRFMNGWRCLRKDGSQIISELGFNIHHKCSPEMLVQALKRYLSDVTIDDLFKIDPSKSYLYCLQIEAVDGKSCLDFDSASGGYPYISSNAIKFSLNHKRLMDSLKSSYVKNLLIHHVTEVSPIKLSIITNQDIDITRVKEMVAELEMEVNKENKYAILS